MPVPSSEWFMNLDPEKKYPGYKAILAHIGRKIDEFPENGIGEPRNSAFAILGLGEALMRTEIPQDQIEWVASELERMHDMTPQELRLLWDLIGVTGGVLRMGAHLLRKDKVQ